MNAEIIKENMRNNDFWLIRGILAIYRMQTDDEKNSGCTKHNNKIGFNGCDSEYMSSISEQIIRKIKNNRIPKNALTEKQIISCRKCMMKYAGQLEKISK